VFVKQRVKDSLSIGLVTDLFVEVALKGLVVFLDTEESTKRRGILDGR
jgi:hypothetical protein